MSMGIARMNELLEELKRAPEIYRPSVFWEELAAVGCKQLEESGLENFKRTLNMSYFNWSVLGIVRHQLAAVLAHWARRPRARVFGSRFEGYGSDLASARTSYAVADHRIRLSGVATLNPAAAWLYKTYVAMLWEWVSERDSLELLQRLDEPSFGNPFLIRYAGRAISQDLCNSVHEFYSAGGAEASDGRPWNVAELGGGYGRVAYVFLKALPSARVCLIDIAPALNVAQEYLTRVLPGERFFYFRPFLRYEEIRTEFEAARIRFLAPHQIELLPSAQFDLFINISSLHEMTYAQIENYLRQIARLGRGKFYTKQWRRSQAKSNGVVMMEHDYPIPTSWEQLYHRRHPIQRMFFEALYKVGPDATGGAPRL